MQETAESLKEYGVLVPALARPGEDGGYELFAGHRRKYACELAGLTTMPVIVRNIDWDAATIIMVDSNLQRENILPSERVKAYIKLLRMSGAIPPPKLFLRTGGFAVQSLRQRWCRARIQRIRLTAVAPRRSRVATSRRKSFGFLRRAAESQLKVEIPMWDFKSALPTADGKIKDFAAAPQGLRCVIGSRLNADRQTNRFSAFAHPSDASVPLVAPAGRCSGATAN